MASIDAIKLFEPSVVDASKYLTGSAAQAQGEDFSDILSGLLENTNSTELYDELTGIDLANGNIDDLHTPLIAAQQAELSLRLTIAVRNKIVDAYSEIMRMQV